MYYAIDKCQKCLNNRPIVNRKYYLCTSCNRERLYPEVMDAVIFHSERSKKIRASNNKKHRRVPKSPSQLVKTHERHAQDKKYKEVCAEILEERRQWCEGCHSYTAPLSFSHTISRKKRKDLATVKGNIELECMAMGENEGCHNKWDSGNISKMMELLNFDRKILYIYKTDKTYYEILMTKINEHHSKSNP